MEYIVDIPWYLWVAIAIVLILMIRRGLVRGVVATVVVVLFLVLVVRPVILSFDTPENAAVRGIEDLSLRFVRATIRQFNVRQQYIVDAAETSDNLPAQGAALSTRARTHRTQILQKQKALLEFAGRTQGDFKVPATHRVYLDLASGEDRPDTWFTSPNRIQICDETIIRIVDGEVNSGPREPTLDAWVGPLGWKRDPREWRTFHKLERSAPFMTLLVRLDDEKPMWNWELFEGKYEMVIVPDGCQRLRFAYNDYVLNDANLNINSYYENEGGHELTVRPLDETLELEPDVRMPNPAIPNRMGR